MGLALAHLDVLPLIYGIVIFIGLYSMWLKLISGKFVQFVIEVFVFALVFKLHGGTMTGGFAATIAALLSGIFLTTKRAKNR